MKQFTSIFTLSTCRFVSVLMLFMLLCVDEPKAELCETFKFEGIF